MKRYEEESLKEILGIFEDPHQDLYKLQKEKLKEGLDVLCDFSSYWSIKDTSLKEACHLQNFISYFCHIFQEKELGYKNLRYHLFRPIIFLDEEYHISFFFENQLLTEVLLKDWNEIYNQQLFLTSLTSSQKIKLWTFGKIKMTIRKISKDSSLREKFEKNSNIFNAEAFLQQEFKRKVVSIMQLKYSSFTNPQSSVDLTKERLSYWPHAKDIKIDFNSLYFQDFGYKNVLYLTEFYEWFWHVRTNSQLERKTEKEGQYALKTVNALITSLKQNLMVVDIYHAKQRKGISSLWKFLKG